MLLTSLSALVAIACSLASLQRLRWAIAPTALSPALMADVVAERGGSVVERLCEATALDGDAIWEHQLLSAFAERDRRARDASVSELLTELEGRTARWARVPRACASISTSAGFFFACIALLRGMGIEAPSDSTEAIRLAVMPAMDALAVGIAGTSLCIAAHVQARRAQYRWNASADRLVARLQSIAEGLERGG